MLKLDSKEDIDLLKVASVYTVLERTKTGEAYARCPLPNHNDSNPSCSFNEKKHLWYCHGCQEGGDIFDLIMKIHGCDFPQALVILRDKHGIDYRGSSVKKTSNLNRELIKAAQWAVNWMSDQLKENQEAKNYLTQRAFDIGDINRWQLGYCPALAGLMSQAAKRDNIDREALVKIGLMRSPSYNSLFAGRIVIPIRNQNGDPVGFVGRRISGKLRKYVNTPDCPVFNKSEVLMNLDRAAKFIRKEKSVFFVEGPLDLLRMVKLGFQNTVCTMGTALSDEQISLLPKDIKFVSLVGDADDAGRIGTLKRGAKLLHNNVLVKVAVLPDFEDPDSLGKKNPEVLNHTCTNGLVSYVQFVKEVYGADISDSVKISEAVSFLSEVISDIPDPIKRELISKEVSRVFEINFDTPSEKELKLSSIKQTKETRTDIPLICLEVIYCLGYHWDEPVMSEIIMSAVPLILEGAFPPIAIETIKVLMPRLEDCGGDFDDVLENTRFSPDVSAVINKAIAICENLEIDWNHFLVSVTQWVTIETMKREMEEMKKRLISPTDLNEQVDILTDLISIKRRGLRDD